LEFEAHAWQGEQRRDAVNSANVGPYGDAILTELILYVEDHFRIIREPYARFLTGGSTGGWEALAQLFHPDFFGGAWVLYPDPIDFKRYQSYAEHLCTICNFGP
jgi:enterochelin esterase-like enzyme